MKKKEILKQIVQGGRSKENINRIKEKYYDDLTGINELSDKDVLRQLEKLEKIKESDTSEESKRINSLTESELLQEVFGKDYIDFDSMIG